MFGFISLTSVKLIYTKPQLCFHYAYDRNFVSKTFFFFFFISASQGEMIKKNQGLVAAVSQREDLSYLVIQLFWEWQLTLLGEESNIPKIDNINES